MPKRKKKPSPKKRTTKKRGPSAAEEFASESLYLKGTDIKVPFDAVISKLERVYFEKDKEDKWVAHLEDEEKSIVLNKINGNALAADFGDDMDGWVGQTIRVFTERRLNPTTKKMGPAVAVCGASDVDEDIEDFPDDDDDIE